MSMKTKNISVLMLLALLSVTLFAASVEDARLVAAAKNREISAVGALLKQQANVNSRSADGATALHWAAYWGDLDMADLLLRAGADVNAKDDLGVAPLALASKTGDATMVQKLPIWWRTRIRMSLFRPERRR